MSSAHYKALEPQTSDEDHEDVERQRHRSVPYIMGRKGSVSAGRRRCLFLAGAVLFIVGFCYLTFSMDTRFALGLGGGSDDSEEHHGLGKKRLTGGRTGAEATTARSTPQVPKVKTTKSSWFENDWEEEEEADKEGPTTGVGKKPKIKTSQEFETEEEEFKFSRTDNQANLLVAETIDKKNQNVGLIEQNSIQNHPVEEEESEDGSSETLVDPDRLVYQFVPKSYHDEMHRNIEWMASYEIQEHKVHRSQEQLRE